MNKQMHYVLGGVFYVDDSSKCKTLSDLPQIEPSTCHVCADMKEQTNSTIKILVAVCSKEPTLFFK